MPAGWEMPLLGDIVKITQGNSKLTKKMFESGGKYTAFSGSGPDGLMESFEHEGRAIILSSVGARCGKCFKANGKWTAIANTAIIRPFIDSEQLFNYLFYLLNNEDFWPKGGTAQPFVQTGLAQREASIPLPPLNEQRRIVAKLEELLAKVDASQQRLAKILVILKRFRQAVLAAACSGRLTADWREENTDCVGANLVFAQKEGQSQGLPLQNGGEGEELPEGWQLCSIADVGKVCNGSTPSRKCPQYWDGDINWVSSGEVRNNIITGTRETISKDGYDNSSVRLLPSGTVLLAMIGEGKTRGQTAVLEIGATINQNIAAVVIDSEIIASKYLWYWFQCQYETTRQSGSGSGPQALNCQRVRELPLNLPPLPEQHEIVRRVEALFTLADQLEGRYQKAKAHVDRLTQSILAKAFRGELVPQDPNDEPASVLLERIRVEKSPSPLPLSRVERGKSINPRPQGEGGAKRRVREALLADEPAAPYGATIPHRIFSAMQPGRDYSRADVTAASGITDAEWIWAIRQLKEEGKVRQTGERRGARYRRA
ncbi:restriction endonuclease subunit S [Geobacter hydrogenophilus]|uniref:restriction endonuclease subunit S n=1 Tax=Geobacter hydrogenophilus TaxID=40983 RepID=UPI002484C8B7|nr:restriction endonuclease subunit S [Geobacter hydrogenophilus]